MRRFIVLCVNCDSDLELNDAGMWADVDGATTCDIAGENLHRAVRFHALPTDEEMTEAMVELARKPGVRPNPRFIGGVRGWARIALQAIRRHTGSEDDE